MMPDKVIDIPGLGPTAFPDSMTPDAINTAAGKLYAEANPKHPPAAPTHSWMDTATDWLPAVGGAVGGVIGGIGGTVAGMGVGGVPGALGGAALGGGAGEAAKQLMNRWRGAPAPDSAGEAAASIGKQAVVQGGAEAVGAGIGGLMAAAGPRLMQAAVKPTMSMLRGVTKGEAVPRVVKTLLDEGVNVTPGGLKKLQSLLASSKQDLAAALDSASQAGAPGVDPLRVASRLSDTARRVAKQVNPAADLEAVSNAGEQFLEAHGGDAIPLDAANALKSGTYDVLRKKYGQLGSADVEAQKALARGLKEEIERQAPGVEAINQRLGGLSQAETAVGRRVAVAANRDPAGLAWATKNPTVFLAALMDRSPVVKSMLARGLYQSAGAAAKVSPQVIRAAVVALTTDGSDGPPAQESFEK